MKYEQDWYYVMMFIIGGRGNGQSDREIIALLEPEKEFLPTLEALLRDHKQNRKAFMAGYKALEKAERSAEGKNRQTRARDRKGLVNAYRKLGRRAYILPDAKRVCSNRGARLQHHVAWMVPAKDGMPLCRKGHPMNLAVYLTAKEIEEFTPNLKHAGDAFFCACMRDGCVAERGTWKLVVKPSEVAKLVKAGGWTTKKLTSVTDYPGHFEPGLTELLREHLPGVSEADFEEALSEVISRIAKYGRSQIGGYGSFANPRWCNGCEKETCTPLITINRQRMGILSKYHEGHVMLVVCRSCGRADFNVECT